MRLWRLDCLIAVALILLTWAVFGQVQNFDFINYDDPDYSPANAYVSEGLTRESIAWALSTESSERTANWIPLTWLSLMLDSELSGTSSHGFHRTNLLLHLGNVLLLYAALFQLTRERWKSALVAALFAVHPLNVESVAWVSERKGLLSTTFGLMSLGAYARYVQHSRLRWYLVAWVALGLSLMCKQIFITLPCLFLLLDYWPLQRVPIRHTDRKHAGQAQRGPAPTGRVHPSDSSRPRRRWIWEKVPFFVLIALFCVVAFLAQNLGGAIKSLEFLSFTTRLNNAFVAYSLYVYRMVWPFGLAVHYPHPGDAIPALRVMSACGFLAVTTFVAMWQRNRRPYLLVGWLWFLGTLLPVIGLVQIGEQQMADRYVYFPMIGLFVAVTWFAASLVSVEHYNFRLLRIGAAIVLVLLAMRSWLQVGYWENSVILFEHALDVTQDNRVAHNNLGIALRERGFHDEAREHFEEALRIAPDDVMAHNNLGLVLRDQGKYRAAVKHFERALQLRPEFVAARVNLGITLCLDGNRQAGVKQFRRALEIDPQDIRAHVCLAWTLERLGDKEGARKHNEAVRAMQRGSSAIPRDLPPGAMGR